MRPQRRSGLGRVAIVAVLLGVLVAGGIADRAARPPATSLRTDATLMPTAAPPDATSSTWYCAGATATAGSPASGTVVVANPRPRPANGTVTVVTSEGGTRTAPVQVGPLSVTTLSLAQLGPGAFAGAVVDLDAGQVVAELAATGSRNDDVTPCASAASDRWYFADGSTARDASLWLSLFNPFPDDAIADLSFSTDQGRASPADFEGIVIPARSLVVKNVGDHVRRREAVSTEVTVRRGRVVAAQTQTRTIPNRAGLSMLLGSPSLGGEWYFPGGLVANGVVERYAVANPGPEEAKILVEVHLDEGAAEPFELSVPPHDRLDLVLNDESRIPKGVGHSATIRSLNGVPFVATRVVEATSSDPWSGRADTMGAPRTARAWAFAAGGATGDLQEVVVVQNVGPVPARVSFTGLAAGTALAIDGLQGLTIEPGRRRAISVGDHATRNQLPLVLRSSVPVVAERVLQRQGAPGLSMTMGIRLE